MTRRKALLTLSAPAFAGRPVKLSPYDETIHKQVLAAAKGKVVLLDFWATWCSPCRAEMPQVVNLEAKLRDRGFRLITISADEPEQEKDALDFLLKNRVPEPMYIRKVDNDDRFIRLIDEKWSGALPAMFLYDRTGRKAQSFIGETETKVLEAAAVKLL